MQCTAAATYATYATAVESKEGGKPQGFTTCENQTVGNFPLSMS
jgi:hypothetical protein